MKSIVPVAVVCLVIVFWGSFLGERKLHGQSSPILQFETISIEQSDPAADFRMVQDRAGWHVCHGEHEHQANNLPRLT